MAIDQSRFRQALSQFATGITVVTTRDAVGVPLGLTVNAFCSVSLDPPLVLVSIDNRSEATAGLLASGVFGISILAEDQEDWSRRFAAGGPEKFAGVDLLAGLSGVPLIPGALAHVECRVASVYPGGDHTLYLGEVMDLNVAEGRPLLYHNRGYRRLDAEEP
jgi:flavin reductase (DIM6/NTAB) family NADH-FMN oxidoreductase RutF